MYKYNGYQVVYSEESLDRLKAYKRKLANKQKQGAFTLSTEGPGKRLKDRIGNRNLSKMDTLTFLNLLLATKKPSIFAESAKLHYKENWSQAEISLLGDFVVATKTTVYHDGKWYNANSYKEKERFVAHLLFVPGALLKQPFISNDNEGSPDIKEVIVNGKLDNEKLYQLYTRRLLPALLHANAVTTSKQGAYVTIPGIGCGQFISAKYCGKDKLKKIVARIIARILKENVHRLSKISAVRFDPNTNGPKELSGSIEGKIDYIVANSKHEGLLHKPEYFDKKYKGCDYFKVVAWDHLSYIGNDWMIGSGITDDGSNFAGTDGGYQLTGVKGRYGQTSGAQNGYLPPNSYATWNSFIMQKNICMKTDAKNLYITTEDGGHLRFMQKLIKDRSYAQAKQLCTQNHTLVDKTILQLVFMQYIKEKNNHDGNNYYTNCFDLFKMLFKQNGSKFDVKPEFIKSKLGEKDPLYQLINGNTNLQRKDKSAELIIAAAEQGTNITESLVVLAINNSKVDGEFDKKHVKLAFELNLKKVIDAFLDKIIGSVHNFIQENDISLSEFINFEVEGLAILKINDMVANKQKFTKQHLEAAIKKNMRIVVKSLCEENAKLVDDNVLKFLHSKSNPLKEKQTQRPNNLIFSPPNSNKTTKKLRFKDKTEFIKFLKSKMDEVFTYHEEDLIPFANNNKSVKKDFIKMRTLFVKIIDATSFKSFENTLFELCQLLFVPKKGIGAKIVNFFSKRPQAALLSQIEALNKEGSNYYDGINEFCTKMKTKVCLSREYISSAGHVKALYGTVNDKSGELNKLNNDNLYYPAKFTKALEMLQINFVFVMSLEEDGYIVWASKTEHDKLQKIIDDFNPNQKNVLKLSLDSKI